MKKYIAFDPKVVWPSQEGYYYECLKCGEVVPSKPKEYGRCQCGNIIIDVRAYRMAVKDEAAVKLFEEVTG